MRKYLTSKLKDGSIILLLLTSFAINSCNKDDDNCQGVECLPPATQTGAGTFGCLVNGVPFVDKSGSFNCFYQLVDGEYYFGITGSRAGNEYVQIDIGSIKAELSEGDILLLEREDNKFYAFLSFNCICPQGKTNSDQPGTLKVTKFDIQNKIVSATFEFTVTDPNTGTVYEITEGRFDTFFTQ